MLIFAYRNSQLLYHNLITQLTTSNLRFASISTLNKWVMIIPIAQWWHMSFGERNVPVVLCGTMRLCLLICGFSSIAKSSNIRGMFRIYVENTFGFVKAASVCECVVIIIRFRCVISVLSEHVWGVWFVGWNCG